MSVASRSLGACAAVLLAASAFAQDPVPPAYPERDMLTPFREPKDVYAPPDELFRQLRIMQNIASRAGDKRSFDKLGREVIDDPAWEAARKQVRLLGLDAGQLAQMMRLHRDAGQRSTAFYAGFYLDHVGHAIELIEHIPGEPLRSTREAAFPRAIEFLRVHLGQQFGDLKDEQKEEMIKALPEPGSPMARAQGLVRNPVDTDYLHTIKLRPFCQLLDVEDSLDQAQALWFLKEVMKIRVDLAHLWIEPSLPRIRQLLMSEDKNVQQEAIGFFQSIAKKDLREPPTKKEEMLAWATEAQRYLFPPIRNLNNTLLELHPSKERGAIAKAGIKALENSSIGDKFSGQYADGRYYRGFRIAYVPDELKVLAIPAESVIKTVNGVSIGSAEELLAVVRQLVDNKRRPTRLVIEYVLKKKDHAIEYRVM